MAAPAPGAGGLPVPQITVICKGSGLRTELPCADLMNRINRTGKNNPVAGAFAFRGGALTAIPAAITPLRCISSVRTRLSLIAVFLCLFINPVRSQNNPVRSHKKKSDYIIIDTVYRQGITQRLGYGRVQFKVGKKSAPEVYTADEVYEFSSEGRIYRSFLLDENKTFLPLIESGKVELYLNRREYLLIQNGESLQLGKHDFRRAMSEVTGCGSGNKMMSRVSYSRNSLGHFVRSSNTGDCNLRSMPYTKPGLYAGYNILNFKTELFNGFESDAGSTAFTAGIFLDLPLWKPGAMYFTGDLLWLHHKPMFYTREGSTTVFTAMELKGFSSSYGIKYFFTSGGIHTYLRAGALLSLLNIHSPTGLVRTAETGTDVNTNRQSLDSSTRFLGGLSTGFGLEFPISPRMNFHAETRYHMAFSPYADYQKLHYSGFFFLGGLNF